jgi:DNA-binding transcriptional ArsR family regulator
VSTERREREPQDPELVNLYAAAHPVRATALAMMAERPTSPKEIAERVGKPIGNVAYHVRELVRTGVAELVSQRKVRGATEHFYATRILPMADDEESAELSYAERKTISNVFLHAIISDATLALEADTLDSRSDRHLSQIPFRLDEEGWEELKELFRKTLKAALRVQKRSAQRLEEDDSEGFSAVGVLMLFEVPNQEPTDPAKGDNSRESAES